MESVESQLDGCQLFLNADGTFSELDNCLETCQSDLSRCQAITDGFALDLHKGTETFFCSS